MSDYTELKRLAEAATQCSGPLRVETDYNGVHQVVGDGSWKILNAWHTPDGKGLENAKFAAAASPASVLALIAENESLASAYVAAGEREHVLRTEVEELRKALKPSRSDCLVCGLYHGGLPCPETQAAAIALSMENQRITPVEPLRAPHPLDAAMGKGEKSEIHHTSRAIVHEPPPTCAACGVQMFTGLVPSKLCKGCQLD